MADERLTFRLGRLPSYDEERLIEELRRVAALIAVDLPLTRSRFDELGRASSSALTRHFGGWQQALAAAGLGDRYGGRTVNARMRAQPARGYTDDQILQELRRVAGVLGTPHLARKDFDAADPGIGSSAVERRFGTWRKAVEVAGLQTVPAWRRWTDDDLFENLLSVWTFYGRQPPYGAMEHPPSQISTSAYVNRFGTWMRALQAFVARMNSDNVPDESIAVQEQPSDAVERTEVEVKRIRPEDSASIRVGLRYRVLRRDSFRCVLCGASPALTPGVQLHVDHIIPRARDGKTVEDNLRTLCQACNLGKGATIE